MSKIRCGWCGTDPLYVHYHDTEWGKPVYDDPTLFEFLILETFQAGLSWITVLRKRDAFRKAFDNFKVEKVAAYSDAKQAELLQNPNIIRNRLKIKATITNAQAFMKIQDSFGSFSNYIWSFVAHKPVINQFKTLEEIPAQTPLSKTISNDLKKRGFKFVGPTVVYAHMQATGMVNDHLLNCFLRSEFT